MHCQGGEVGHSKRRALYGFKIIDEHIFVNGKMFDKEQIKSIFRLSYARTYASCQGCEFDTQPVCLCDTQHPHFQLSTCMLDYRDVGMLI